jgi:deoxyadenosine/deoxycytidine kinase
MNEFSERKYFVAIAGNIGVGKTTLARALSTQLDWQCYLEPVINNPYLDDFYADMSRWAFHLQVYFLSKRFESQREIENAGLSCVQDRTIYEDVEVFAATLHNRGHLVGRDWDNYRDLFRAMTEYLRPPDLIVYLRCDVPTLLQRIKMRGRPSEMSINPDYLYELNDAYEAWLHRGAKQFRIAVLETGHENELNSTQVLTECLDLLRIKLQLEMPLHNE